MRRGFVRAFVAAICVSGSTACSLITLDGLVGDGGTSADAGDAGVDALSDVASKDSGVSDAPGDAPAADGSWCALNAPTAFFCNDFDTDGFTRVRREESLGGTMKLVTGDALSAPNAALADCPHVASDLQSAEGVMLPGATTARATVATSVRIDKMNTVPDKGIEILAVIFRPSAGVLAQVGVGLGTDRKPYAFRYQNTPDNYVTLGVGSTDVPVGAWARVVLTIDGVAGKATATFDGAPIITNVSYAVIPSGEVSLVFGAFATAGHNGWKIRHDNIVFDPK
ncbi:MAG: hypothetical protein JWM74_2275 [Myxococcaceae bacterium]|nr:hypothetical protein [Myxococcaceae bacterium]